MDAVLAARVSIDDFLGEMLGYTKNFMLNSAEHEILNAHQYKNNNEFIFFSGSDRPTIHFPSHKC